MRNLTPLAKIAMGKGLIELFTLLSYGCFFGVRSKDVWLRSLLLGPLPHLFAAQFPQIADALRKLDAIEKFHQRNHIFAVHP